MSQPEKTVEGRPIRQTSKECRVSTAGPVRPRDLLISEAGKAMQSMLFSDHLDHWATVAPDRDALTFIDYSIERGGVPQTISYQVLDRRVTAAAARLQQMASAGDRVAILLPQGLSYLVYFMGALRAGIVAVPLFSPDLPGHGDRLAAIFADSSPKLALSVGDNHQVVLDFVRAQPGGGAVRILNVDQPTTQLSTFSPVTVEAADVAYIQYTSGSTRTPAGVLISQANIVANASQAILTLHTRDEATNLVSWLPLFHDMGLVFVAGGCVVGGLHAVFMDPIAFLIRPLRWMTALAGYPNTISMAPNFAFDYVAAKVTDAEKAELDLSDVHAIANGAEPVRADTLARFNEAFGGCGLRPEVVRPSYGLAEATVYVCGGARPEPAVQTAFDFGQLSAGFATTRLTSPASGVTLVSVGIPNGQFVAIAHPSTSAHLPEGEIGEVWVHGPNVSAGYWNKPDLTEATFGRVLLGARGVASGSWLRTGDLGTIYNGELYITGRMKDVIIVDGRNHYPQDLEATIEDSHVAVGRHRSAAFSVTRTDDTGGTHEGVVIVAEISRHADNSSWDTATVSAAIRRSLSQRHRLAALDVVLVAANDVPRTSSGKIARAAARERYLAGELNIVA